MGTATCRCQAYLGADPSAAVASDAAAAPGQATRRFTDHVGNKLAVELDAAGKVVAAAWRDGNTNAELKTYQVKLEDLFVCGSRPGGTQMCQPFTYMAEGSVFKMGSASCTCRVFSGILYCYGNTCQ